jgi:hypothetical protein
MNYKNNTEKMSPSNKAGWRVDDFFKKLKDFFQGKYFIGILSSALVFFPVMIVQKQNQKAEILRMQADFEGELVNQHNEFMDMNSKFRKSFIEMQRELYQKNQEVMIQKEFIIELGDRIKNYRQAIERYNETIKQLLKKPNQDRSKSEA